MKSIINSFVLYRKIICAKGEKLQLIRYIRETAMQLVEKEGAVVMNKCRSATTVDRLFTTYFSKQMPPTVKKGETYKNLLSLQQQTKSKNWDKIEERNSYLL